MARLRRPLLLLAGLLAVLLLRSARREVREIEEEAALWAEATDTLD